MANSTVATPPASATAAKATKTYWIPKSPTIQPTSMGPIDDPALSHALPKPVLRLIAEGNTNKEIATQLSIAEETVKSRVKSILDKLGANDRTHAVTIAVESGARRLDGVLNGGHALVHGSFCSSSLLF